jgi:hypothetical protein
MDHMKIKLNHDIAKPDIIIKKEIDLKSHLVCDNDNNKVIGNVYLSESQAYQLNKILKSIDGKQHVSIIQA